ncbi:MAG: metalloregulator ArsR/SmtB family transcription factor [Bryobacteraceae bacterium]|nr:metalloregulator ArsR/SmtB family transcription factor [Bryobacteraceae bacterium]
MQREGGTAIPTRVFVTKELAKLLGVLAHPHRIRIIEELRNREMDVNSLQQILAISHSSVSQNLSVLRSHRLVQERRAGRHVIYSLCQPKLAGWLLEGLQFLEGELALQGEMREAVETARQMWSDPAHGAKAANKGGNGGLHPPMRKNGYDDESSGFTN